jgi:hypothetical protein
MSKSDPIFHQQAENLFVAHVDKLLSTDAFRVDTSRGSKSITGFLRDRRKSDGAVDLKRIMTELGQTDRDLQAKMPVGQRLDVEVSTRKWLFFKAPMARISVISLVPTRELLTGDAIQPITAERVKRELAKIPPSLGGVPTTIVLLSTSGFTADARELVDRRSDRVIFLAQPNDLGGWSTFGPTTLKAATDLLDPEADDEKQSRLQEAIRAAHLELLGGGLSADKIASRTSLPLQWVEAALKDHAKANPGLVAKRLDGRVVLFREGSGPTKAGGAAKSGGLEMPFMDSFKALFSRKGETEKKISLLSERRAQLSQQRDLAYDDLAALEENETRLKDSFKTSTSESAKRRLTSQLLQARKDLNRKQQLMSVLNQQIDVVSTHLHTLELVQQGKGTALPSGEDLTKDAEAAEEVMAQLQADRELAGSLSTPGTSLSDEEQALYDELQAELAPKATEAPKPQAAQDSPTRLPPEPPQRQREREAT